MNSRTMHGMTVNRRNDDTKSIATKNLEFLNSPKMDVAVDETCRLLLIYLMNMMLYVDIEEVCCLFRRVYEKYKCFIHRI